ncbi:hypothetical protein FRC17_004732, partial [Serendipita sp. 399]
PPGSVFPIRHLAGFPQLRTLGIALSALTREFPESCRSLGPSLTLVLFGLHYDYRLKSSDRRKCVKLICDAFDAPSKPFSEVVVPFEWAEIENIMVQACELPRRAISASFAEYDPLPCRWSILQKLAEYGIPIRDRSGVSMREGTGANFVQRMEAFINDEEYTKRIWKFIEVAHSSSKHEGSEEGKEDEVWDNYDDEDGEEEDSDADGSS